MFLYTIPGGLCQAAAWGRERNIPGHCSPGHHGNDTLQVCGGEVVVHGEAEYGIRQGAGHGDAGCLGGCGISVGGEDGAEEY